MTLTCASCGAVIPAKEQRCATVTLHLATCENPDCELCGFTVSVTGYQVWLSDNYPHLAKGETNVK